jgi:hypothetical protein
VPVGRRIGSNEFGPHRLRDQRHGLIRVSIRFARCFCRAIDRQVKAGDDGSDGAFGRTAPKVSSRYAGRLPGAITGSS